MPFIRSDFADTGKEIVFQLFPSQMLPAFVQNGASGFEKIITKAVVSEGVSEIFLRGIKEGKMRDSDGTRNSFGRKVWKTVIFGTVLCLMMFAAVFTANAATKKSKAKWVYNQGYYYYYNAKGKYSTGLTKIGKKQYYFDSYGRQRVGWRKIKGSVYYFNYRSGKNGYMITNKTIDRIKLTKNGKARLNSDTKKLRAEVYVSYATWVDSLVNPSWTDAQKIQALIQEMRKRFVYGDEGVYSFNTSWALNLAKEAYERRAGGHLECERFGICFAYLCHAAGIKNITIHIGGQLHAFVQIGNTYYDPTFAVCSGMSAFVISDFSKDVHQSVAQYRYFTE